MSYDLDLYLPKEVRLIPPQPGEGALFNLEPPARCDDEDIAPEYLGLLGKRRRWLVRMHIEGAASPEALGGLETWLAETLSATGGLLIDEQAGTYQTASKTGRLPGAEGQAADGPGQMTFFLEDANGFHECGLRRMLDVIARELPEALPARFGPHEPLQGRVTDGDTSELLSAFLADPDLILKAKAPFGWIMMSVPCDAQFASWHPQHFIKQEFLATSIRFELRKNAFNDPRLIRLFNALSDELHVFYSEIRRTECPVRAWFWRGLPPGPVDAFCLGGPYPALWPEAAISAVTLPGGTLSVTGSRIAPDLPEPPGKLIAPDRPFDPRSRDRARYADGFPFTIPGT